MTNGANFRSWRSKCEVSPIHDIGLLWLNRWSSCLSGKRLSVWAPTKRIFISHYLKTVIIIYNVQLSAYQHFRAWLRKLKYIWPDSAVDMGFYHLSSCVFVLFGYYALVSLLVFSSSCVIFPLSVFVFLPSPTFSLLTPVPHPIVSVYVYSLCSPWSPCQFIFCQPPSSCMLLRLRSPLFLLPYVAHLLKLWKWTSNGTNSL